MARVEVSIAGGAWAAASGTDPWRYNIPFSAKLKNGKKYSFSARALSGDGAVLATQTGDVMVRENHDINGDGYADFVVAAPARNSSTGSVYIYYGTAAPEYSALAANAQTVITGGAISRSFGTSLALGDINGDGYADLAVGAEQDNSYQGAMWIFYGRSGGIPTQSAPVTSYTGLAVGHYYGGAVAMGDLNGDGYQDVVVGSRERSPGPTGEIYAYLGSASGLSATIATPKTGTGGERLGSSLTVIDVNNDGLADIVVGAPTASPSLAYVFHGTVSGFNTAAAATITGEAADRFGDGVFTGDFNNDGYIDIGVQARDYTDTFATQGKVYFFSGSAAGFSNFTASSATHLNFAGEQTGSSLGRSIRITDANGDGFADLLFSAYLPGSIPGKVYSLPGSATGFTSANAGTITRQITGITNGDGFGICMSVKDINADGFPDMVVGAYNRNGGQGTVSVILGSSAGFSSQSSAAAAITLNGEASGDNFGIVVY